MGNARTDEGAGFQCQREGDEPKSVGKEHPVRRRTRRTIAKIKIDGKEVKIWLEGNLIHFRQKHQRRVAVLSLTDAHDFSLGQTQFYYAKGN